MLVGATASATTITPDIEDLRYRIVRRTQTYDLVQRNKHLLRVGHGEHYVAVRGIQRYRVVKRYSQFVVLRRLAADTATGVTAPATGLSPSGRDDTAAIQAAVNARGAAGGSITFAPGTYTVSSPIMLPAGNTSTLTLSGSGATIKLTNQTPRFLAWATHAAGATFRKFVIDGFAIDAGGLHPASGSYSVLGFEEYSGGSFHNAAKLNVEELTISNCTVTNVATSPTSAWNPCVINIRTSGSGLHITDVLVQSCRIEGGSRGINIWGADSTSDIDIDRVYIRDCWHDTGIDPVNYNQSTNYHIGQWGHVGTCEITGSYGNRSFDCGIEIDNASNALIADTTIENSYKNEFYYTNFTTPMSGNGKLVLQRCTARVNVSTVPTGDGFHASVESGLTTFDRIDLNSFTTSLLYGSKTTYALGSTVAFNDGFYVDGVGVGADDGGLLPPAP